MFRFIAFSFRRNEPQKRLLARLLFSRLECREPSWQEVIDVPGLMVFCISGTSDTGAAHLLSLRRGAVLGTLFKGDAGESSRRVQTDIGECDSDRVSSTHGRYLIEGFWGRYVAFLTDPTDGDIRVIRDPTGSLPCMHLSFDNMEIFFSYMEDCLDVSDKRFSFNLGYLSAHVALSLLELPETAISEINEIQAGECLRITPKGDHTRCFYWNPVDIATSRIVEDRTEAATLLRDSVEDAVRTWAQCFPRILHTLSGGLDSSIVLACLANPDMHSQTICLNYRWSGSEGDERRFSRLAAERARCTYIEVDQSNEYTFADLPCFARSARPSFTMVGLFQLREQAQLARKHGATGIFGGGGGDQLFYQNPMRLTPVDYFYKHGIGHQYLRLISQVAASEAHSIWNVLIRATIDGILKRDDCVNPVAMAAKHRVAVNPEVFASLHESYEERFLHPWFMSTARLPPGKRWQAYALSFPSQYYDYISSNDDPERVHPLMSQRVLEACLRIPTYVLAHDGRDRALARSAFSHTVPREILLRHWKAGSDNFVATVLKRNRDYIREVLLDGVLVRERLLCRAALEKALSNQPTKDTAGTSEIFVHLSTETWARNWQSSMRRRELTA